MNPKQLIFFRILLFGIIIFILASCARAVSPDQAASGSFKKCRAVK